MQERRGYIGGILGDGEVPFIDRKDFLPPLGRISLGLKPGIPVWGKPKTVKEKEVDMSQKDSAGAKQRAQEHDHGSGVYPEEDKDSRDVARRSVGPYPNP